MTLFRKRCPIFDLGKCHRNLGLDRYLFQAGKDKGEIMRRSKYAVWLMSSLLGVTAVFCAPAQKERPEITKSVFGKTPEGQVSDLYTLTNANGMQVRITNYG